MMITMITVIVLIMILMARKRFLTTIGVQISIETQMMIMTKIITIITIISYDIILVSMIITE